MYLVLFLCNRRKFLIGDTLRLLPGMSGQASNGDKRSCVDNLTTEVNSCAFFAEGGSPVSSVGKQSVGRNDLCSFPLSGMIVGNDKRESLSFSTTLPPSGVVIFSATPFEAYVRAVIDGIEELQESVGLFRSLSRTRDVVALFKDHVAVFKVVWFSEIRECFLRASETAKVRLDAVHKEQFSLANGGAEINVGATRRFFAQRLKEMTDGILLGYYRYLRFPRRSRLTFFQNLFEQISDRWMQDLFRTEEGFPCDVSSELSVKELDALLLRDFELWASSIFPYLRYALYSWQPIRLIWLEGASEDKKELAFQIHYAVTRKNLLNRDGKGSQGVLFPIQWINDLLLWLCDDDQKAPVPLGPFDTFRLVELSSDNPVKHVVREDNKNFDIIPEELFDLFWRRFGGGPKYLVSGPFRMKDTIENLLKPPRVSLAIVFEGLCEHPVQVDKILHRATLLEVFRRAFHKLQQQRQGQGGRLSVEFWRAALCAKDALEVRVTRVYGQAQSGAWVILSSSPPSVGELLNQLEINASLDPSEGASTLQLSLRIIKCLEIVLGACGVCGLANVGNTCYMNSAFQCLSNLRALRRELFSLSLSEYPNSTITTEMVDLFLDMWSGRQSKRNLQALKTAIGRREKRFAFYEQQDAMEFIEILLDYMHEEMNIVSYKKYREILDSDASIPTAELSGIFRKDFLKNNRSFIPKLFFHQSKTRFTCLKCGMSTTVFDNNSTLAVTVVTPVKPCAVKVVLLMPTAERLHLRVFVTCDARGAVYAADVERALTEPFFLEDVFSTSSRTCSSVSSCLPEGDAHRGGTVHSVHASGGRARGLVMDGHRVILHGDCSRPLPINSEVFFAAVVPLRGEIDQKRDDVAGTEATSENGKTGGKNMGEANGEKEVFLWYFLKKKCQSFSSQHELCHVERISERDFFSHSFMLRRIFRRSKELCERFLKGIHPGEGEAQWPRSFSAEESVDFGNAVRICLFYKKSGRDVFHRVCEDDLEKKIFWERLNADIPSIGELRFLLEYDDSLMSLKNDCGPLNRLSATSGDPFTTRVTTSSLREFDDTVTIEKCLESTFLPETLTGDDARFCDKCHVHCESKIERGLFLLPPCLIISLKRFKVHVHETSKNDALVNFSTELDMAPYLDPESPERNTKYTLRGVVTHRGFLSDGHYTASAFNDSARQWIHYDDSSVFPLSGGGPPVKDAFILCYERDEGKAVEKNYATSEMSRL